MIETNLIFIWNGRYIASALHFVHLQFDEQYRKGLHLISNQKLLSRIRNSSMKKNCNLKKKTIICDESRNYSVISKMSCDKIMTEVDTIADP